MSTENTSDSDEESQCPICLISGGDIILCELDCYLYRTDNNKHFMCMECVKKLFNTSRWYSRTKCPFCRHTIHRKTIMDQHVNPPNEPYFNRFAEFINNQQNLHDSFEPQLDDGSNRWKTFSGFLAIVGMACYYYDFFWIAIAFVCMSIIVRFIIENPDYYNQLTSISMSEMMNEFDQFREEMRIIYQEQTTQQRPARPLRRVRNKKRKNRILIRKEDRYRNTTKKKKLKINKGYQKRNKRQHNRSYR